MVKSGDEKKAATLPKVKWDDAKLKTSYANVCNVTSTREEVTLLFGTNQAWHAGQEELTVELNERIILSPFAAKRLLLLLTSVVNQYEQRFGQLSIETGPVPTSLDNKAAASNDRNE
jgi:hypothetical protein